MLWHEQSWPALQAIDKRTPVIVPLGSCEQHGPHLPLFVDSFQVARVAEQVERTLGQAVLLVPTLWLGSSHHHKDFPGPISVRPSLYLRIIKDVAGSILSAGFKRIVFLNGHGGNRVPAGDALAELVVEDDRADDAYLVLSSWWEIASASLAPQRHGMQTPGISHACEYETSLMLAIRPDLVHLARVRESQPALSNAWIETEGPGSRCSIYRRFHRLTASGSMGKPSAATVEKGRSLLDAITADVVAFLCDFQTWPDLPVKGPKAE